MKAVGNDIVMLNAYALRAAHPRFFSKILSQEECGLADPSLARHIVAWLAWSVKEAVFKVVRQQNPAALFAARKYTISHQSWNGSKLVNSTVVVNNQNFYCRSEISTQYIHSVATSTDDFSAIHSKLVYDIPPDYAGQSAALRRLARSIIEKHMPGTSAVISKTAAGQPLAIVGQEVLPMRFSFSHDGSLGACVYTLPLTTEC